MLSKPQINYIQSLHNKKFRNVHSVFLVEGIKSILEFVQSSYQVLSIYTIKEQKSQLHELKANIHIIEITNEELLKISVLQHPQGVLAIVKIPDGKAFSEFRFKNNFTLALDSIQDPGNMGTIIRTADWFGIHQIICSPDSVDVYNPKVVQASMGSLSRVQVHYQNLPKVLEGCDVATYATVLNGTNIYQTKFGNEGVLILGNEGNGISEELTQMASHRITIPTLGVTESLNVATCAAVCCSEMKRGIFQ